MYFRSMDYSWEEQYCLCIWISVQDKVRRNEDSCGMKQEFLSPTCNQQECAKIMGCRV